MSLGEEIIRVRATESNSAISSFLDLQCSRLWEQNTPQLFDNPGLLRFAVLSNTGDPEQVLSQVSRSLESIPEKQVQSNLAAATSILTGLVLMCLPPLISPSPHFLKNIKRCNYLPPLQKVITQQG